MPFTLEASRPAFYIVNASDLIAAYVNLSIINGKVPESDRALFTEVLMNDQTSLGNITFGDTEYSLVTLARWLKESDIEVPVEFINSNEGIENIDPHLIYVNMGQ